jgi:predicted amidohydrolase YtcJ
MRKKVAASDISIKAAELTWDEQKKGSIEVGKFADLIVLDHDLTNCDPKDILKGRVVLTVIDGEVAHDRRGGELF